MVDVTTPRSEYKDMLKDVTRNRDAVAGERTIKSKTVEYLPPLESMCISTHEVDGITTHSLSTGLTIEGQAAYNKYLSLTYFYGASGRTVDGLVGLIFSKKPVCELNTKIEYLKTNANGKGDSLRTIAQNAATEAFISPQSGVLVDFPIVVGKKSKADAESQNLRPKICHYKFESIYSWFYETINNEIKLTYLVLKEPISKRVDFEIESTYQYRVLEIIDNIYQQSIYDDDGGITQEPVPIMVNGKTSDEIPFFFIKVGAEGKSIINDLVDANLHHYTDFSNYGAFLHTAAFPVFTEAGVSQDEAGYNNKIGMGAKWTATQSEANWGVLQVDGNADCFRLALQDMEQRMAALGAEMLKPRIASAESAESKSLDQVAQNSTTSNVAITVSEVFVKALDYCARWMGAPEESVYELNTDYGLEDVNPQLLAQLIALEQGGRLGNLTIYEYLQKNGVANVERTFDDEMELVVADETGM